MGADLKQLLLDTHHGDEPAARDLWRAQAPRLLHYARAIVASHADAEDVVQAVFCKVLRLPRGHISGVNDVAAWLAQATRREAINHMRTLRREAARRHAAGEFSAARSSDAAPGSPDPELHAAIDALPRRLREILVLRHVAGLTFDQIADATGLNRSTAAARYRAGVDSLKAAMATARGVARGSGAVPSRRATAQEIGHAR